MIYSIVFSIKLTNGSWISELKWLESWLSDPIIEIGSIVVGNSTLSTSEFVAFLRITRKTTRMIIAIKTKMPMTNPLISPIDAPLLPWEPSFEGWVGITDWLSSKLRYDDCNGADGVIKSVSVVIKVVKWTDLEEELKNDCELEKKREYENDDDWVNMCESSNEFELEKERDLEKASELENDDDWEKAMDLVKPVDAVNMLVGGGI